MTTIPTYIINLRKRTDRRENILKEFAGRNEFSVNIVEAIEHETGAIGLWNTIKQILQNVTDDTTEFVLICEDDHQFNGNYSKKTLWDCIAGARERGADVLCGGVSWFEDCFPVSERLFWVQKFSGLQFTIIFRKFFATLLNADFGAREVADYKISGLTQSKFVIHPYISIQTDYGYSDATSINNQEGRVGEMFLKSDEHFQRLKEVNAFYKDPLKKPQNGTAGYDYGSIKLPVYVINLPQRTDRLQHIKRQFSGRNEFDVTIVEATRHEIGNVGLWLSIRSVIRMAIENDDDVIIICEDDHEFTKDYSPEYLFKNVIEAHSQGVGILIGGVAGFSHAFPITENRYWVNWFWTTQFVVLYKQVFSLILDQPFDETMTVDGMLSEITSNKMVIHPFVSVQKHFGYSDVTIGNNISGLLDSQFAESDKRLKEIQNAYLRYIT